MGATAFAEPGRDGAATGRPDVRSRPPTQGTVEKNYWRFDPNISWYGPGFFGNGTACGQTLTRELVGVAHRTLPCGTMVTFRYNGKTVSAPVIDRGPYVAGRTWDLSKGLCTLLDHCFTGTIEWKMGGRADAGARTPGRSAERREGRREVPQLARLRWRSGSRAATRRARATSRATSIT